MTEIDTLPFGERLPHLLTPPPGAHSRALAERLERVESRNVTFRSSELPIFWERARGSNVEDVDGNLYLDLTGAFGVAAAGHGHPRILAAIEAQGQRLVHGMGDVHPPEIKVRLLERLQALTPWSEGRAVLATSGAEAVEIALKTALLATERPGILAFEGGYHGLTIGALSVTAREDFRAPFQRRLSSEVAFLPFPDTSATPGRSAETLLLAIEKALRDGIGGGTPIGAILIEPIQGRGGIRVPPPGFLMELMHLARQGGALLIVDEIFTGMGRTGTLFAFEAERVIPDLICVGKALGGGLPLSACLGRREVMDAWPQSEGEALHTSTFLGHPLAAASALAFLDLLESESLIERARIEGDRLLNLLARELAGLPAVREVRGRGLFLGIELTRAGSATEVMLDALRAGLLILPAGDRGEVIELTPPLTTTRAQLDWAANTLIELVQKVRP